MPRKARETGGDWQRVTVGLYTDQIKFLDKAVYDLKMASDYKVVIERSAIIRALVEALKASGFDFTGATSEQELTELLTARLRGRGGKAKSE